VLDYLLERKAVDDLASSIKDGRYGRQKAAMRATGLRRLLYVLEGEPASIPSAF
jgi:crossover junction endonuclease MUS81